MSKRRKHKARRPRLHRGLHYHRVESDKRLHGMTLEAALADAWEEENTPVRGTNHGHGVLQDLMIGYWNRSRMCVLSMGFASLMPWNRGEWARFIISRRDAAITATAIQWLGTNCGRDFLRRALERAGYRMLSVQESEKEAAIREQLRRKTQEMQGELERLRRLEALIGKQREELESALR